MSAKWPLVRLGDVLGKNGRWIEPRPDRIYREVTVRLWGKGVVQRREVAGAELGGIRRAVVRAGQFILSRIDARNGAMGIVPDDLDGALVTNDFPTFTVDESKIDRRFLGWMARTRSFVELCKAASEGTTNRVRLQEDRFVSMKIPLPPLPEQRRIVAAVESAGRLIDRCRDERATAGRQLEGLLLGAYSRLIEGAERCSMHEIAPVVRRPVEVHPDRRYIEIGVRSFGRGLFSKPPVEGLALGDKRVYTIRRGDLIFMNVFAWEGAVAVASDAEDGLIGSHRYITCVPEPHTALSQFLCFHFLTPRGLSELGEASPGGAGRNRTLGVEKLERIEVPVPHLDRQKMFVELMMQVEEVRSLHEDCSTLAQGLMKSHVHGLLGAETEVPGASS